MRVERGEGLLNGTRQWLLRPLQLQLGHTPSPLTANQSSTWWYTAAKYCGEIPTLPWLAKSTIQGEPRDAEVGSSGRVDIMAESDSTSFWDSSRRPQKPSFDSKKNNLNITVSVPDPPSGWEVSDGEPHYSHIHFTPLNKTFLSLSKKILKLRPRRRQLMFMFRHFFAVTLGHGSFSQPRNTNIFS